MRRNNTYKKERTAGFTLVELIVVLVMLSILTAVAVPSYLGYVDNNKEKQCNVERKAIASHLEEMQSAQVTGTTSDVTDELKTYVESQECPAGGGHYLMTSSGESVTIKCSIAEHGETTVLLKGANIVTAKASTQTEAPTEAPGTNPPSADNSTPMTPRLSLSISPNPVPAMEIGATAQLTADPGSPEHCTVNDYEWRSDNNGIVSVDRNGQTVTITAVGEGTCTIYCKAKVTASEEAGGYSFDSAEVGVQVTVNPAPSLSISLASAQTLSVPINTSQQMRVTSNPVRCNQVSYDWQVTNGSATTLSIMNNSDGSATVTASEAGDYTVTCLATAISEVDSSTIIPSSNQVTVNIKVASLSISVDPNSVSDIEVGSTIKLTALPNYQNCTVNGWQWDTSDWNTVKINDGWGTPSIIIEPQKAGTCNITCYATAAPNGGGDNISSNIVTIPVTVKEKESESESESGDLLTGVPNPYLIEKNTNGDHVHSDLTRFEAVKGGVWSSSDSDIAQFINTDYEQQQHYKGMEVKQTGELDLTYTVNGQSQTIHAKVVSSHTYLNVGVYIKDQIISDGNKLYVPSEATVEAVYGVNGQDWASTDGPVSWEILTPEVIEAVSVTGEHNVNENFTVRAKTAGIAKVKARLQYEFSGTWDEKVISFIVYGEDENQLIGISADPMTITPGKKQMIKFNYSPWNANTDGIEYIYSGYDEECISINSETNEVTALAEGSTKVKVEATKDGIVLAECEFDVTVAQITGVRLEPGDMILCPNESIPAEIKYEPADADLSDIDFEITGYDTNNIEITWTDETHVTITAGENTGEWWPTVQAKKRTDSANALKSAQFHVKVTKIKSINVDPNPVTFTPNEEKTVKLVVDPLDADLTGLTFELNRWENLPELKSVDFQNKTITLLAHEQVGGEWYQGLTVKENYNALASCNIRTKVEAASPLTTFSIDDISVQEDSAAKVVMHLVPENADLAGVEFNYQCADATAASVTADGVVKGLKAGKSTRVTASASKNGETFVSGVEFTVTVTEKLDPTRLTAFQIDPVYVQEGSTAKVNMQLIPENPDLTDVTFYYGIVAPDIATISTDGTVTGIKVGDTKGWVSAKKTNGNEQETLVENTYFDVHVTKMAPTAQPADVVEIQGQKFGTTSWDDLKSYLRNASATTGTAEELPDFNLYIASQDEYGQPNKTYYLLCPGVDLQELNIDDDMTFEAFVAQRKDLFCKVNQYNDIVTWAVDWYLQKGQIVLKGTDYYVYTGDGMNLNSTLDWNEYKDYFVRISKCET